jgi:phosphoenolpyruvate carboxykinase (ATP)
MGRIIPRVEEITIEGFREAFRNIVKLKEDSGLRAILNNPPDLFERAKLYGVQFRNGSWGWASNIWHRSAAGTVVVEKDLDLKYEHRLLMLRVLEHILAQGPLIQVDAVLGKPKTKAEMHCRLYCDPQFPDIAYRWSQICFPGDPEAEPDVELFCIPHYLGNPNIPGTNEMLRVLRFPHHNYSIVTCSSYQGEVKKGFLSHWIYHVYRRGGTGEHASLKEFTVRRVDGSERRIVMCIWALTGAGKSTHGFYVFNEDNAKTYQKLFGVNPLSYVRDQVIKNDDVVAVFRDQVIGSEKGSWTKTEDIDEAQVAIWRAANSPRALHENTEFNSEGNPCFKGVLFQYFGTPNRNARSVFFLEDTGYFNGDVASSGPLNVAVFISPGYFTDYAWVKINDSAFAAKVLADGRSIGHPAQSRELTGLIRFESRYCLPFTIGVRSTEHVVRFYEFLKEREESGDPIEVYQLNTIGGIGTRYRWVRQRINGGEIDVPEPIFELDKDGLRKPAGGVRPTIEETQLFLLQAVRGAVDYEPHPIWGWKVLVPVRVEGISEERLRELNPLTYRSMSEMIKLLKAQVKISKIYLDKQCPDLPGFIYNAMDFS